MKVMLAALAGVLFALLVYPLIPVTFNTVPQPPAPKDLTDNLSEMLSAAGGRDCISSGTWKGDDFPSWAVVSYLDGKIVGMPFDEAWNLAIQGKVWVLLLCED